MRHLILYYNTIRFLKFKQLFFQLWYRGKRLVWKTFRFRYSFDHTKEGFPLHIIDFIHKYISAEGINSFHFLNKTSEFTIMVIQFELYGFSSSRQFIFTEEILLDQ